MYLRFKAHKKTKSTYHVFWPQQRFIASYQLPSKTVVFQRQKIYLLYFTKHSPHFSATQLASLNEKFQKILTEAVNEQNEDDDHNLTDAAKIKEKKATDE